MYQGHAECSIIIIFHPIHSVQVFLQDLIMSEKNKKKKKKKKKGKPTLPCFNPGKFPKTIFWGVFSDFYTFSDNYEIISFLMEVLLK